MKSRYGPLSKWPVHLFRLGLLAGISYIAAPVLAAQAENDFQQPQPSVSPEEGAAVKNLSNDKGAAAEDTKKDKADSAKKKTVAANDANTITVTGTRLSQSRLSNVMAGSTLGEEQIAKRGYSNLGLALLRENPAFSVPYQ